MKRKKKNWICFFNKCEKKYDSLVYDVLNDGLGWINDEQIRALKSQ